MLYAVLSNRDARNGTAGLDAERMPSPDSKCVLVRNTKYDKYVKVHEYQVRLSTIKYERVKTVNYGNSS